MKEREDSVWSIRDLQPYNAKISDNEMTNLLGPSIYPWINIPEVVRRLHVDGVVAFWASGGGVTPP